MISKYRKLEKIAQDLKFTIKSGRKTICDIDYKVIKIKTGTKLIKKIFMLAHELGHATTLKTCIGCWGTNNVCCKESAITYGRLESELIAWSEADKLIKRIDLYGDEYLKVKHKCLKSYYLNYKKN